MKTFYLGTHQPNWLDHPGIPADVALFVSERRLAARKTLPRAKVRKWGKDSGGFSELSLYDEWRTTPLEYVTSTRRHVEEIGNLAWAAPQDWMCEPFMIAKTGLSVTEHQRRTVDNFVQLSDLWGDDATNPFMPVLQGWERDDYLRCWEMYSAAGINLSNYALVGLGSVCRRQATDEIGKVVDALTDIDPDLPLHGFGVKKRGLERYGRKIKSADSLAWSFVARREDPMPGCVGHINCANCPRFALDWYRQVESLVAQAAARQADLLAA